MRSRRAVVILSLIIAGLFALALFARPYLLHQSLIDADNMGVARLYQLDTTVEDSLFIMADQVELLPESRVTGDAAFISSRVEIGGRIDGDLTVTGDSVTLLPGAVVNGDALLLVDSAELDGSINGDITFSGDQLVLAPDVVLNGSVAVCRGEITNQAASVVVDTQPCAGMDFTALVDTLRANIMLESGSVPVTGQSRFIFALGGTLLAAFGLAGVATLGVALFPRQLGAMSTALRQPRSQFITGLLTVLLLLGIGASVIFLMAHVPALSIVLVPLAFILTLAFGVLALAGTIPITISLGGWLLGRVSSAQWPPLVTATVGSLALALLVCLPVFVPYGALVTLAATALISTVAVGAALSTRLGTRGQRNRYFVQG